MTMAQLWLQLKLPRCHMLRLLLTVCVPPMACIMPCAVLWLALLLKGAAALSPDGLALLDFKTNLTNGGVVLFDWLESDATPCRWQGVTCASDAFSVSELWLNPVEGSRRALEGILSSSLFSLASLTVLYLNSNKLSGSIPPEIANARSLNVLELGNNRLSGSIPSGISNMRNLTTLSLWGNSLTGSIPPLDSLTDLQNLYLDKNSLSGPIPNLSLLTKLLWVHLGGNNLSASAGKAPDLANLRDLQNLELPGCDIGGAMPTWLAGMPNLTLLNLFFNQLGGPIGEEIWANKSLVGVDLSSNHFNGSIPGQLLHQLRWSGSFGLLNLSSNGLTGRIPDTLTANAGEGVFTVDLSNNRLDGPIPSSFGRLGALRLQNNRLEGEIGSAWSFNSSGLFDLRLQDNNLTGELGPSTYAQWQGLKFLDLSRNVGIRLVDESLTFMLNNFTLLQELRLSNIRGNAKLPMTNRTSSFTALTVLDLSRSGLEDDLFQSPLMANAHFLFPNLQSLDLSGNGLTGAIPLSFTRMPNLTFLNLSNNRLSGKIPLNLPPRLLNATFFSGNPDLCGFPLEECSRKKGKLEVKLVEGLVACVLLLGGTCLFFTWRLRRHSKRHRQDADLIAILQGRKSANLMSLADLRKATSNFSKECQIGVGGFGEVYKGKLDDGTLVAIKKSKRQGSQRDKDQFLNEVEILSQVNHRFLVQLLGCCLANKVALLVFEFVPNGTLEEHLRSTTPGAPPLTWTQRLRIALDTADALAYLHSSANPPIFHRDVKSANILLDHNMDVKVADFGISKLAPLDATHVSTAAVQGTRGYIDPEYYVSYQLTAKSDVFSFGVVLLELISGRAPLESERGSEDASLIGVAVPLIKSGNMEEVIDPSIFLTSCDLEKVKESVVAVGALAVKCLELKSKDRPNMREVFKDLQILWLQFEASTVLNFSDQRELGSGLSDLENLSHHDSIEFVKSRSFHSSSTARTLSSLRKLADVEEQMASLNR